MFFFIRHRIVVTEFDHLAVIKGPLASVNRVLHELGITTYDNSFT